MQLRGGCRVLPVMVWSTISVCWPPSRCSGEGSALSVFVLVLGSRHAKDRNAESAAPRAPASLARLDYLKLTQSFRPGRAMSSLLSLVRVFASLSSLSRSTGSTFARVLTRSVDSPFGSSNTSRYSSTPLLPPLLAQQLVQAFKHEKRSQA